MKTFQYCKQIGQWKIDTTLWHEIDYGTSKKSNKMVGLLPRSWDYVYREIGSIIWYLRMKWWIYQILFPIKLVKRNSIIFHQNNNFSRFFFLFWSGKNHCILTGVYLFWSWQNSLIEKKKKFKFPESLQKSIMQFFAKIKSSVWIKRKRKWKLSFIFTF